MDERYRLAEKVELRLGGIGVKNGNPMDGPMLPRFEEGTATRDPDLTH